MLVPSFSARLAAALLLAALAVPVFGPAASAQTQTVLFPGQSGATLRASLRAAYRPSQYGTNDNLYADIDRMSVGGQSGVVCVYTGFFVPFDGQPSSDPSQDVFNNDTGINQEHTWPKAQLTGPGDPSDAEKDLHNLFPSRIDVNAFRGNSPFAEIPDAQTSVWYRLAERRTTAPTSLVDEYSELLGSTSNATSFEPREDHQGDVARAVFYIEAVYPDETVEAWFAPQIRTLYDWHRGSPASAADQARSGRVARFQSGKDNPFVLDSTLVRRAFLPNIVPTAGESGPATTLALRVAGEHPFRDEARLTLSLGEAQTVRAEAFDALGRRVAVLFDGTAVAGTLRLTLDGTGLAPGVYAVRVVAGRDVLTRRLVRAQ